MYCLHALILQPVSCTWRTELALLVNIHGKPATLTSMIRSGKPLSYFYVRLSSLNGYGAGGIPAAAMQIVSSCCGFLSGGIMDKDEKWSMVPA
jgi:hypothetical protein